MDVHSLLAAGAKQLHPVQWLVVAGWECQDLSPAGSGQGLHGRHSSTFHDLVRIIGLLQNLQKRRPPAYLLENAATQHNFKHVQVRSVDHAAICSVLGPPVCVDAAQLGARAHRLRNWWSNLADPRRLSYALMQFQRPPRSVQDAGLLGAGRVTAIAEMRERAPWASVNEPGKPVVVWPTLVAHPYSYAFQPGKPGAVQDSRQGVSQPSVRERELALGYAEASTWAPGVTDAQRHAILGKCMDAQCLEVLIFMLRALFDAGLTASGTAAPSSKMPLGGEVRHHNGPASALAACMHVPETSDVEQASFHCIAALVAEEAVAKQEGAILDVWHDHSCISFVREGMFAEALSTAEAQRVQKRARSFCWREGKLYRRMADNSLRECPPPSERNALIRRAHEQLGHFGMRRTAALLRGAFWWHGLIAEVQQLVSTCKVCDQANAGGTSRAMQAHMLPVKGPFYRWGVDTVGPFAVTEHGHCRVMVAIEHFTKHVELIPMPDKTSRSTAAAMLAIIARFGAPAEILTDQGTEYQGAFEDLLAKCFIDHRTTSAQHPQANGAAERIVQVVKKGLRKYCQLAGNADTWDEWLPWLLLGYRCSPQKATGFSPYYLVHGVHPVVPPAIRERFAYELDFPDMQDEEAQERIADIMSLRALALQQACATAGHNIAIAQHRDSLRYAHTRSGQYKPRVLRYQPGDYVYVRRGNTASTLQMGVHNEIYRVVSVSDEGVATLQGKCGSTIKHNVERLQPCHLTDIDPRVDSRLRPEQLEAACQECGESHDPHELAGCSYCGNWYHIYCLKPTLGRVPGSEWICGGMQVCWCHRGACTAQGPASSTCQGS